MQLFDYQRAFSRNIGWLTPQEQNLIRNKKIAIAGLGGVGGHYLLTLVRMGVCQFSLAEFDRFELENFNRQIGANLSSIEQPKLNTMIDMAKGVNPELDITHFDNGITLDNLDPFLHNADLYIDGLDFFALDIREAIFKRAYELHIPCITVAPLGMGAAMLVFMPQKMSFNEYFGFEPNHSLGEKTIHFITGLAPSMIQQQYLVYPSALQLEAQKGPSTPMGCDLCAGVGATQAIKILLERGDIVYAPNGLHFDAFLNTVKKTWVPFGAKNPLIQYRRWQLKKKWLS